MKKGVLITFVLGLMALSLVSAQYGYGSSFSISGALDYIDASTAILGSVFFLVFIFVNFSLLRVFKGNKAFAGIAALCVAFLVIWGINQTGFDYQSFFYDLGIASEFLGFIAGLVLLVLSVFIIIKVGFGAFLFALGALLMGISYFSNEIYHDWLAFIIGMAITAVGAYFVYYKYVLKKK